MAKFIRPIAGTPRKGDSFNAHRARGSVNPGQDYAVPVGTAVRAPAAGYIAVDDDGSSGAAGISVVIYHDNGYSSDLMHLSRNVVRAGQRVAQGQVVGYSGNTGASTGPHLHWTLRNRKSSSYNGVGNVDPEAHLSGSGTTPATSAGTRTDQERLNVWASHDGAARLVVDGVRGKLTIARIKDFQRKHGLTPDGVAGPLTDAVLATNPPGAPKPKPPTQGNPFGLSDVIGLQKIARLYGARTALDNVWGPESARGFAVFLQRRYGGSLARWLRTRWGYVGNSVYGPVMRLALKRANAANKAAL